MRAADWVSRLRTTTYCKWSSVSLSFPKSRYGLSVARLHIPSCLEHPWQWTLLSPLFSTNCGGGYQYLRVRRRELTASSFSCPSLVLLLSFSCPSARSKQLFTHKYPNAGHNIKGNAYDYSGEER
jgi:hypothetical protein